MARTGRRPGSADTRADIVAAARRLFGERGYDRTTIRGIAVEAGVDAALVHHFFGTKERVFVAAMEFPFDPAEVVPGLVRGDPQYLGERIVRFFLSVWEESPGRDAFVGLIRSSSTNEAAASMFREFVSRELLGRIAQEVDIPLLRVEAVGSQLMGVAMLRYVLRVEPMASVDQDTLVALVAPTVQRYLTGD